MNYVTEDDIRDILNGIQGKIPGSSGGGGYGNSLNVSTTILLEETNQTLVTGATFTLPEDYTNFDEIVLTTSGASTIMYPNKNTGMQVVYFEANNTYMINLILNFSGTTATVTFAQYGTNYTSNPTTIYLVGKKFHISSGDAPDFIGATSSSNGERGLVPEPQSGDNVKYLCGDGTWKVPSGSLNAVVDTLWSGGSMSQKTGDVLNLSHPYTDYNYILIKMIAAGTNISNVNILNPADGNVINMHGQGSSTSETSFNVLTFSGATVTLSYVNHGSAANEYIFKIEGIKFLNPNVYSTTEQRIGTWIDGKPIYQKTLMGTFSTITDTNTKLNEFHNDLSSYNIDKTIDINGRCTYSDGRIEKYFSALGGTTTIDTRGILYFAIQKNPDDNNKLYLYTEIGSWYSGRNFTCDIKYTKTTD